MTMQSKLLSVIIRAVVLVAQTLPLACSQRTPVSTTGFDGGLSVRSDTTAAGGAVAETGGQGGMAGLPGDDRFFVPEGLSNSNLDGQDTGLILTAFTLAQTTAGPKLYAAVRNDDDTPACEAGMTTSFVDKAEQIVTESGSALQSGRLYQMDDGTIITCIAPGQVAMAASTDLLASMMVDQLGSLKHRFPAFRVPGVVPIPGLSVNDVQTVATDAGTVYAGTVTNGLHVTVSAASVTIFPVNRVARPLGAATSSATSDIPPGGSWTFTTSAVDDLGVDYLAFATASIAK